VETVVFSRTFSGKINKSFFLKKVIFFVEGNDDVAFYAPFKRSLDCRFESADGKPELIKLALHAAQTKLPYVAVLDDDFDVISGRDVRGDRVVYVGAYSMENLLAQDEIVREFVQDFCGCNEDIPDDILLSKLWTDCGDILAKVVIADLAAMLNGIDRDAVPARIDTWIRSNGNHIFIREEAWADFQSFLLRVGQENIDAAATLLDKLSSSEICAGYLRGHLVFGLLRNRTFNAVKAVGVKAGKAYIRKLVRILTCMFWRGSSASRDN
jgi:hypothetical protein